MTPAHGVLDGMTRRTTLELCRALGIAAVEAALAPEQVRSAAEVFLTTTAGGIIPVTSVDGRRIADGRPGPRPRACTPSTGKDALPDGTANRWFTGMPKRTAS